MTWLDTLPGVRREPLKAQDAPVGYEWLTRWQAQETIRLSDAVRQLERSIDDLDKRIDRILIAMDMLVERQADGRLRAAS